MPEVKLYDMNKAMYSTVEPITEFDGVKEIILNYVQDQEDEYLMLLNNDKHYYTIFHYNLGSYDDMTAEVLAIVRDLGPLKDVIENDHGALEFWIEYMGEMEMFVLFPYDQGVIEV